MKIYTLGTVFTLLSCTNLNATTSLYLSEKDIDDTTVAAACSNPINNQVIDIDLSNNKKVTLASINLIKDSDIIGSTISLPKTSGRYNLPSSDVFVNVEGTDITREEINDIEFIKKPFVINYLAGFPPVQGIKILKIQGKDKGGTFSSR
jgi:hypothetical protein